MDLIPYIEKVELETRTSSKTNRPYQVLVISFENGYKLEQFLNNEQKFIIESIAQSK